MMGHNHSHAAEQHITKPFILGILLNAVFVTIEFIYGFASHSLSLVADAWHNLGDAAALAISLLALRMADQKPNPHFTYGYSKGTILASLANGVLLLIAIGFIGYEAINRLIQPVLAEWGVMTVVAAIGIVINSSTALLFVHRNELNSKAAFLHMAADAGVSLAVVLGGIALHFTGFIWIDPIISIIICLVILIGTWRLLKSSLSLSLDGVPDDISIDEIQKVATSISGVLQIFHIHVWAVSTTRNALTAHLLVESTLTEQEIGAVKHALKHQLEHMNIQHATLEVETKPNSHNTTCK